MTTTKVHGHEVPVDIDGKPCLTAIWKLAGKPKGKEPSRFKALKRTKLQLLYDEIHFYWRTTRGRGAGTWAHWGLAEDYMNWVGLKPIALEERRAAAQAQADEEFQAWLDEKEAERAAPTGCSQEESRRRMKEIHEQTLRDLERLQERHARDDEARAQGFESYQEYDPDRSEEEDNGVDHGDDWMDGNDARWGDDESACDEPAAAPAADRFQDGPDDLFFDFMPHGLRGMRCRASVN